MRLPDSIKPSTFPEGQRAIFGCLVAAAGVAHFAFAAAVVAILVWGKWPEEQFGQIIEILGYGLFLLLAIDAVVVISLSLGGPVGRLKLKAGKDGFEGEATGDGETPFVQQTTIVQGTPVPDPPQTPPPDPGMRQ